MSVLVGWHFSGGGNILLALHQIPLQPDQLSPKCLADHPTSPTTAIPIQKMDARVSAEDVSTFDIRVFRALCMSCIQVFVMYTMSNCMGHLRRIYSKNANFPANEQTGCIDVHFHSVLGTICPHLMLMCIIFTPHRTCSTGRTL